MSELDVLLGQIELLLDIEGTDGLRPEKVKLLIRALQKCQEQRDETGASWDDYNEIDKPKFDQELLKILRGE